MRAVQTVVATPHHQLRHPSSADDGTRPQHQRSSRPLYRGANASSREGQAPAMMGTSAPMAWFTAVPIVHDELSTCSSAGETR